MPMKHDTPPAMNISVPSKTGLDSSASGLSTMPTSPAVRRYLPISQNSSAVFFLRCFVNILAFLFMYQPEATGKQCGKRADYAAHND